MVRTDQRFKIRRATVEDCPAIHGLVCELAVYEREPDAVKATPDDFRRRGFGERPAFEVLIAERGGEAIGFALFFFVFSTWTGKASLHLEDLFVRRTARGAGVGKGLFAAVARIALERDCERYEWQVLDWNQPAVSFYEAQGARALRNWIPFRLRGRALATLAKTAPALE